MFENDDNLDKTKKSTVSNSYEETVVQLEGVLKSIESQGDKLGDLLENVEQANALVEQCRNQLRGIEENVNHIL